MSFTTITDSPVPSAGQFEISPVAAPPPGTSLIGSLQWNNLIAILDGSSVDKISATAIAGGLVSDTEFDFLNGGTENIQAALDAKEVAANKGAVSGYAGLDASQLLLLANFPAGSGLQVLRRNTGNTALEFFTLTLTLDSLSDTTITSAAAHEVLVRNAGNTAWVNELLDNDNLSAGAYANITGLPGVVTFETIDTPAILTLTPNRSTPATGTIGDLIFSDNDSIPSTQEFARIRVSSSNITSGAEEGEISIRVVEGGTSSNYLLLNNSGFPGEIVALHQLNMLDHAIVFTNDTSSPPANSLHWIGQEFGVMWHNAPTGSQHDFAINGSSLVTVKIQSGDDRLDLKNTTEVFGARNIQFGNDASLPDSFLRYIQYGTTPGLLINAASGDTTHLTFDANVRYSFNNTDMTFAGGMNLLMNGNGANGYIDLDEITTPATPATNHARFYAKDVAGVAHPHWVDQAGTETDLFAAAAITSISDGDSSVTVADAGAGTVTTTIDGTAVILSDIQGTEMSHRFAMAQGTDTLISSNRLIWPDDGNYILSGGTNGTLDVIRSLGWQSGSQIQLRFDDFATNDIIHQSGAAAGDDKEIFTINRADHVDVSTDDIFSFMYDSATDTWREIWNTLPKVLAITSTDNAIARYDLAAGQVQNSGVLIDDSDNITGVVGLTATGLITVTAGTMRIPLSATPTMAVDGDFAIDTTVADFTHGILKYFDGEELGVVSMPIAEFTTPADGALVAYNATNDEFELVAAGGGEFNGPYTADIDFARFDFDSTGVIYFHTSGPVADPSVGTSPYIWYDNDATPDKLEINVPAGDELILAFNQVEEFTFTETVGNWNYNQLIDVSFIVLESQTTGTPTLRLNRGTAGVGQDLAGLIEFRSGNALYGEISGHPTDIGAGDETGTLTLRVASNSIEYDMISVIGNVAGDSSATISFHNHAMSSNIDLGGNILLGVQHIRSDAADIADAGFIRMGDAEEIRWEDNPASSAETGFSADAGLLGVYCHDTSWTTPDFIFTELLIDFQGHDAEALGQIQDSNQNEQLIFAFVASAVNEFTMTNAITANGPILAATGGDTDIDLNITPKGVGLINLNGDGVQVAGDLLMGDRFQGTKGADAASQDEVILVDGNYFDITGTTQIHHIRNLNWQAGSVVTLQFDDAVTVTHLSGSPTGDEADLHLAGATNASMTADDTLTLVFDGTLWREVCRSVN